MYTYMHSYRQIDYHNPYTWMLRDTFTVNKQLRICSLQGVVINELGPGTTFVSSPDPPTLNNFKGKGLGTLSHLLWLAGS
jgi:hypothetical protein